MAKRNALDALDWDTAPVFGEMEGESTDQIDRSPAPPPELAIVPERPPAKGPDRLIPIREAVRILDVTRTQVDHWVKAGVLAVHGKTEKGLKALSLEEVQAFAAERASRKGEKELPALQREQSRLERVHGFASPADFARSSSSHRDEERRHVEMIEALRELRLSQEASAQQQLALTRVLVQEQRETNEQLSTLNTALLVASLGAAGAALLPDHFLQEIKAKVGGAVGRMIRPDAEPVTSLLAENGAEPRRLTAAENQTIIAKLARRVEEEKNRTK